MKRLTLHTLDGFDYALAGMPIVESVYFTKPEDRKIQRSWKQRLFTRPWTPWVQTRTITVQVPRDDLIIAQGMIICHPELARMLKEAVAREVMCD